MKRLGKPAFNRLGIQGLPYGFGPMRSKSYMKKILTPNADVGYDPSSLILYHPMNEAAGGVAIDHSPEGNDGAYTGVTLGQPGIGDGLTCPFFDRVNDYNNIYSVGLNADFDGDEGSLLTWVRFNALGDWTDGNQQYFVNINGTGEQIFLAKVLNNTLRWYRRAGGVTDLLSVGGFADVDWMHLAITWSVLADELVSYKDGAPAGAIQNTIGAWATALIVTANVIGAQNITPTNPHIGLEAHTALYTAPLPPAAIAYLSVR